MPVTPGRATTARRRTAQSASTRVISNAETIEASTPIARVTPKPRTGPEARKNSSPAASRVVTLESMMALQALPKPVVTADRRLVRPPAAYSSLARSNTRTFASIAIPMASTKPASPGKVSVAPRVTSVA